MTSQTTNKFSPEVRERAVQARNSLAERQARHPAAIQKTSRDADWPSEIPEPSSSGKFRDRCVSLS
jgi:hypothetical protein